MNTFMNTEAMLKATKQYLRSSGVEFERVCWLGMYNTFLVKDVRIEYFTLDDEKDVMPSGSIGGLERMFDHDEDGSYKKTLVVVNNDSWLLSPSAGFKKNFVLAFTKSKVVFMTFNDMCVYVEKLAPKPDNKKKRKAKKSSDKNKSVDDGMVVCECGKSLKSITSAHKKTKFHIANSRRVEEKTDVVEEKECGVEEKMEVVEEKECGVEEKTEVVNCVGYVCPCGVSSKEYTLKHLNSKRHQLWLLDNLDHVDNELRCECGMFMKKRSEKHDAASYHQEWLEKQLQEEGDDIEDEQVVEQVVEDGEQVVEPVVEQVVEPVVEQVVEQVVEPVVEQVVEPVVEQVVEQVVEPVVEQAVEPVAEQDVNDYENMLAGELDAYLEFDF
jgi:hypothetical protein